MPDSTAGRTGPTTAEPPWRTTRRPARQPLRQETIVATALRVLDKDGLEAVTMRRVAQELGTGPASLYAHVANKDELLELLLDEVLGEIALPEHPADEWREGIRAITRASRLVLQRHRDVAKLAMVGVPTGPHGLRVTEVYLATLRTAGMPDQVCAWAVDRLALYVTADVLEGSLYRARHGWQTESDGCEYWQQLGDYLRGLPAESYPHTVQMVDALLAGNSDDRFEHGLDMILDGLAKYLPTR
ncbi:MAG: TetR/AcrR family transcriptional regulator [Actinocatenispora sp.]